ncbi:MAG: hypothetical protein JWM71_2641, partial [Solirubrobacteraceae bacterium]|nr:hypothetical protein [Solirubrobacteraceae bacterium]
APRDARVAGAAAALALAQSARAPCALVLEWGAEGGRVMPDRPAVPSARRLAAGLARGGHVARVAGRVVTVALPVHEDEAASLAASLSGRPVPSVTVVAGPRGAAIESYLSRCSVVVLLHRAGADEELTAMAAADLGRLGPPVVALELALSPLAGMLARCGVCLASSLSGPLVAALGGRR